jgi:hypothetical protein
MSNISPDDGVCTYKNWFEYQRVNKTEAPYVSAKRQDLHHAAKIKLEEYHIMNSWGFVRKITKKLSKFKQ